MIELYYATTRPAKVYSLQRRLVPLGFTVVQAALGIPEPRFSGVEDTAVHKVLYAYNELQQPVVANDSGFFMHDLRGFPGTFVNYALSTVDVPGILRLADLTDRTCMFRHALAFHDGQGAPVVFVDEVAGTIAPAERGVYDKTYHWSALVKIFIPNGLNQTLGELDEATYADWSSNQRPKPTCAEQFVAWYQQHRTMP
jgi:XTP/dITP diphosphohydrolase